MVRCVYHTAAMCMYADGCGMTVNDMHKAICLRGFEVNGVEKKVQLLLDASGAKIKSLKRKMIVSSAEAARGIWSGMHAEPFVI
jgi:large subunit ribosomal protein L43